MYLLKVLKFVLKDYCDILGIMWYSNFLILSFYVWNRIVVFF